MSVYAWSMKTSCASFPSTHKLTTFWTSSSEKNQMKSSSSSKINQIKSSSSEEKNSKRNLNRHSCQHELLNEFSDVSVLTECYVGAKKFHKKFFIFFLLPNLNIVPQKKRSCFPNDNELNTFWQIGKELNVILVWK
jgi:hypothetical protein